MSVNIYKKDPLPTEDELTVVATKGKNRVWTGTKAAASEALLRGDIGNGTVVYITDDYDTTNMVDNAEHANRADVASKIVNTATNEDGSPVACIGTTYYKQYSFTPSDGSYFDYELPLEFLDDKGVYFVSITYSVSVSGGVYFGLNKTPPQGSSPASEYIGYSRNVVSSTVGHSCEGSFSNIWVKRNSSDSLLIHGYNYGSAEGTSALKLTIVKLSDNISNIVNEANENL